MNIGKLGVWAITDPLDTNQLAELARAVEGLGYGTLWYPESSGYEAFSLAGFLLSQTEQLNIATGIANIYGRDATTAKQGQHTLARFSGGRFLLGLGVSHIPLVEGTRGHSYGQPVATMRTYLDGMEKATEVAPALDAPPPTVLAALGPNMTRLAAERTAGVLPYCITPERTAWAREIVGPDSWICAEQKVLLCGDASRARDLARNYIGRYLQLPNYRNNWLRMGFSEAELGDGGSDRFLDAMVVWGDEEAIRERINAHLDAGADHVCIQTLHPEGKSVPHMKVLELLAP